MPSSHEQRLLHRENLRQLTDRLIADYAGRVPAGTVMRAIARHQEQYRRAGDVTQLLAAVESTTRAHLDARVPAHAGA